MEKTKKKVNKKVVIPLLVIFSLAIVCAGVVTYISNTAKVNVSVTSPMKVWLNGDESLTTLSLGVTSAEPIEFTVYEKNVASKPIEVYNVMLQITSPVALKGTEFESILLTDGSRTDVNVLPYLKYIKADGTYDDFANIASANLKTANLMMASNGVDLNKFTFNNGNTHESKIVINPVLGMSVGNYTIKACDVYNLVGATCA